MSDANANAPATAAPVEAAAPPAPPTFAERFVAAGIDGAVDWIERDNIPTAIVPTARFADAARVFKDAFGYDRFLDITAIDHVESGREDRFEIYLLAYSQKDKVHARIKTFTSASMPSITPVYIAAHNYEREVFDLYGVTFVGHPSLTRILMPDGWQGHPMRRDADAPFEPVDFTVTRELYNT